VRTAIRESKAGKSFFATRGWKIGLKDLIGFFLASHILCAAQFSRAFAPEPLMFECQARQCPFHSKKVWPFGPFKELPKLEDLETRPQTLGGSVSLWIDPKSMEHHGTS